MLVSSKLGLGSQHLSSSALEIEIKLPPVTRAVSLSSIDILTKKERLAELLTKAKPAQATSLSEIFFGEGITRFNSVLGGAAFISVSLGFDTSIEKDQALKQNTFVRLWSVPSGELRLERRHNVEPNSPCMSDQLIFSGENVGVTQSPDASLIAVTSENMIGVYEIRLKGDVPYFKWSSSYMLPEGCQPNKVTFHVGSAALTVKSNKGDIDWIEIKTAQLQNYRRNLQIE